LVGAEFESFAGRGVIVAEGVLLVVREGDVRVNDRWDGMTWVDGGCVGVVIVLLWLMLEVKLSG
jgi:hypothetical protein